MRDFIADMAAPVRNRSAVRLALHNPNARSAADIAGVERTARTLGMNYGLADAGGQDAALEAKAREIEQNPVADAWTAQDENNVAFLNEDRQGLSDLYDTLVASGVLNEAEVDRETVLAARAPGDSFGRAWERGSLANRLAGLGLQADQFIREGKTEELEKLRAQITEAQSRLADLSQGGTSSLFSAVEQLPRMIGYDMPLAAAWASAGATAGGLYGAAAGGAAGAGVGAFPGAAAGAAAGGTAGYVAGTFYGATNSEKGAFLADMLLEKDDAGNYLDPEAIALAANLYGNLAGAVEAGFDTLTLRLGKPVAQALRNAFAKGAGKDAIKAAVRNQSLRPALRAFAAGMGKSALFEGAEEALQEGASIQTQAVTENLLSDSGRNYYRTQQEGALSREGLSQMLEAGMEGAKVGMWFYALPGGVRLTLDTRAALRAGEFADAHREIADRVAATRTRELSPARMESYLQTAGLNGDVLIPADAALQLQQGGMDIAAPLGWDVRDMEEAAALGHDIVMPVARLQARLQPDQMKAVADIMREAPDAKSAVEAANLNEDLPADLDAYVEMAEDDAFERSAIEGEVDRLRAELTEAVKSVPHLQTQIVGSADPDTTTRQLVERQMGLMMSRALELSRVGIPVSDTLSRFSFQGLVKDDRGRLVTPEEAEEAALRQAEEDALAPFWDEVWGRLDADSLRTDFPEARRELAYQHGRGLFAKKGQGLAVDELADELRERGLLDPDADSSTLIERLKELARPNRRKSRARQTQGMLQTEEKNTLGVPLSRVTRIAGSVTREELDAALSALAGRDLPNLIEGVTAQVNANQKRKLESAKAREKSVSNGFSYDDHTGVASQIANAWRWAAEARRDGDTKHGMSDVNIRRFVSALNINGQDAFAWMTVKETPTGLRIYSVELMDEKKLRGSLGNGTAETATTAPSGRSYEEIIERLSSPVNEQGDSLFQTAPGSQSCMDAVRKQYEGTEQWMKAPNGNPLANRFADMPMIEADSSAWFGEGKAIEAEGGNLRKALQAWAKKTFPEGMTVRNADQGWEVRVSPRGITKTLSHGYDELLARSVPFIPQIIKSGLYLGSTEKKPGLMSHIFANKIRLDGQDYVVGFVLREDVNGNRFYDHELTEIINPDSLNADRFPDGSVVHAARANRGDVMNILREKMGVNDGTGRILFQSAWHGTPHRFDEFSLDAIGTGEGAQERQKTASVSLLQTSVETDVTYPDNGKVVGEVRPDVAATLKLDKPGAIVLGDTGLQHIEERHGKEIRSLGFHDGREFAEFVLGNLDAVYDVNGNGRKYDLVSRARKPQGRVMIRLEFAESGDFYRVVTAGPLRENQYKNKTPLWERAHSTLFQEENPLATRRASQRGQSGVVGQSIDLRRRDGNPASRNALGATTPDASGRYVIQLFAGANLSTLTHETAHVFFLEMERLEREGLADDRMLADLAALREWTAAMDEDAALREEYDRYQKHSVFGGADFDTLPDWQKDAVRNRAKQEMLARGFEQYLREGKAPSRKLEGLFSRFRKWLMRVYREARDLHVELTDEVRDVFDRMLAHEEEMDLAAEAADVRDETARLLDSLELKGAKRLEIGGLIHDAVSEAAEKLRHARDANRVKQLQGWAKDAKEQMEREQVYIARKDLRKTPLDLASFNDVNGEELGKALVKKLPGSATRKEGGVEPEVFAAEHGYESAAAMARDIIDSPTPGQRVKQLIDERQAEHDALFDADDYLFEQDQLAEQQEKIVEALEAKIQRITAETRYRREVEGKTVGGEDVRPTQDDYEDFGRMARWRVGRDQLRTQARAVLDKRPMGEEVLPEQFRRAASRWMQEERRAILKGNFEKALEANYKARINIELARQSAERRDLVEKLTKKSKKFLEMDKADTDARFAVFRLSQNIGLFNPTRKMLANAGDKGLDNVNAFFTRMREEGFMGAEDIDGELFTSSRAWKGMTWEEFRPYAETMTMIMHMERESRTLATAQGRVDMEARAQEIADSIYDNNPTRLENSPLRKNKAVESLKKYGHAGLTGQTYALLLDGDVIGPAFAAIVRPINQATWKRAERLKKETKVLKRLFSVYTRRELVDMKGKKISVPGLSKPITKEIALMAALNSGNEGNLQRLLEGEGWTREQLQAVLDTLDNRDFRFVQGVWDFFESFRKESFDLEESITGVRPEAVQRTPLQTRFGVLRGGYFPIAYDAERSAAHMDVEELGRRSGGLNFPIVEHGSMKRRAATGKDAPLCLRIDVIPNHAVNTIHMLCFRRPVMEAAKILRRKEVKKAIEETAGVNTLKGLDAWLKHVAGERAARGMGSSILAFTRKNLSFYTMAFKITTMLMQVFGSIASVAEIGPRWVAKGFVDTYFSGVNPVRSGLDAYREVAALSPMMANRIRSADREIFEASSKLLDLGSSSRLLDPLVRYKELKERYGFIPMSFVQMVLQRRPGAAVRLHQDELS